MRLLFTPDEIQHLTFRESPRKPLSADYLNAREVVWQRKLEDARARGLDLWNGEVYTVERFVQPDETHVILEMSTCEYKDITFAVDHTIQGVIRDYGADHLHAYITINCIPVTEDDCCVFGLRTTHVFAADNMIGLIGGTANKDEMAVQSLDEVRRFMQMEMQEETDLPCDESALILFGLHHYRGKYEFLYTIRLPITADKLPDYHKPGEFTALVGLTPEEAEAEDLRGVDAFRFNRGHLREIVRASHTCANR